MKNTTDTQQPVATENTKEGVHCSAVLGDSPPPAPESEGRWWVTGPLVREWRKATATYRGGHLWIRPDGHGMQCSYRSTSKGLYFGGRLAVNGDSPNAAISDSPTETSTEGEK